MSDDSIDVLRALRESDAAIREVLDVLDTVSGMGHSTIDILRVRHALRDGIQSVSPPDILAKHHAVVNRTKPPSP